MVDGSFEIKMMDINVPKAHTTDEEGKLKWFVLAYFDSHPGGGESFSYDDKHKKCSFLCREDRGKAFVDILFFSLCVKSYLVVDV